MFVTLLWSLVLLTSSPKNNRAKFFLGIFMFVCFLLFLSYAFYFKKQIDTFLYFDLIFIFCALSVFPLNYCYIKLLTVETTFRFKDLKMFLPAFIFLSISVINYLIMSPEQRYLYVSECIFNNNWIPNADFVIKFQKSISRMIPYIYVLQIIYTYVKGRKCLKEYNKTIANFYSNIDDKTINWAGLILNSLVVASIISFVFSILGRHFFMHSQWILLIPSASFSTLLFIVGYLGNIQNHTVANLELDVVCVSDEIRDCDTITQTNEDTNNSNKLKVEIVDLFENKQIFTNPNLKIVDLANMLKTNRTYVSSVINNDFSCTFSRFVNQYRIRKAKEIMVHDTNKKYALELISHEVGFGSLHTFIRVFKELEGITPGAFRDKE